MKKPKISMVIVLTLTAGLLSGASAQDKQPEYVGAKKCKICHSKPKLGVAEYLKWEKQVHSKAYEGLAGEEAKRIAEQAGVSDPQNDEKCLKCHITTLTFTTAEQRAEGVGCERCHGPGSLYKSKKVMQDHAAAVQAGMRNLKGDSCEETMKKAEALCRECHGLEHKDENPAAKEFNFAERWAQVKHDEETLKAEFPEAYE